MQQVNNSKHHQINLATVGIKLASIVLILTIAMVTHSKNIMGVYQLAIESDPQLRAAQASLSGTKQSKRQAWANFLPKVNGDAGYTQIDQSQSFDNPLFGGGRSEFNNDDWSLSLNQSIYNQAYFAELDQSKARISEAEASYQAILQNFLLRVATVYFQVLSAQDQLDFSLADEKALKRQLEQATQRFEVGLTAITDVHEAQAGYDAARARTIIAENNLDDAMEAIRELTGEYISNINTLKESIPLKSPEPVDIEEWVTHAVNHNPRLLSVSHLKDLGKANVALAKSARYPTLDFAATRSNQVSGGEFGSQTYQTTLGVQFRVPLYTGGLVTSRIKEAQYGLIESEEQYEQELRAIKRETRNSFRLVVAGISEVEARQQALISAQSALEATQAGFEVGTRTIVDTLIAQQSMVNSQRSYSTARYNYLLSTLQLKQVAGNLSLEDLEYISQLLIAN